jgi:membrane protein DedA with SNARE-associated domain/membrane-associated phospholipid phosphatase
MALQLDDLKPFIDWLQANPGLASFAVFLISCTESFAILGLFIPGTIIMPAIGSMIGAGVLPAHWIILAAIMGAIVGDTVSYWLGHYFHEQIRNYWPFSRFPKMLIKGESFFKKYGSISVFIGRFVGPVRPIIPVIAGMLNMTPTRFIIANIISAILWALVYMAPGILLGAISEQLAPHVASRLLLILALSTLIFWFVTWSINKLWNYTQKAFEHFCKGLWCKASKHFPKFHSKLLHQHAGNHKPFSIIFYIAFLIILLVALSISVTHHGLITYLDWLVFLFLRSIEIPPFDNVMASIYYFTNAVTLYSIAAALFAWLILQKAWRVTFYWGLNIAITYLIIKILQHFITMPPPDSHSHLYATHVFPSVSLGILAALFGNFLMLSYYSSTWLRYKKPLLLFMFFLLSCAALPKLYFGFHWLSNCLASVLCAAIATWICILFFHRKLSHLDLKPILFIASAVAIIATSVLSITNGQTFITELEQPEFNMSYNLQKWWNNEPLPILTYRKNILGEAAEPLSIEYAGNLKFLTKTLEKQSWQIAPKASLAVILNRIGAKTRYNQLPLFPDLYLAKKPNLIMTKIDNNSHQMLILRLWSSGILLQPHHVPLWIGTIHLHTIWHWHNQQPVLSANLPMLVILQADLAKLPSNITQPKICQIFCQANILKLFSDQKIKEKEIDHEN